MSTFLLMPNVSLCLLYKTYC